MRIPPTTDETNPERSLAVRVWSTVGIVSLIFALFTIWYSIASDYGYRAVSGTYAFKGNAEKSILVLREDRSFQQELVRSGKVQHAEGTWRLLGQSGIEFSSEFQDLSDQKLGPAGEHYGSIKKQFGLFVSIALNSQGDGPVFRKQFSR
jgi:hypothetical protein